jgi:hypothetical protein
MHLEDMGAIKMQFFSFGWLSRIDVGRQTGSLNEGYLTLLLFLCVIRLRRLSNTA